MSHGRFVWYDLSTTDVEAARAFYAEVIGWGVEMFEGGDKPYPMWKNGEHTIGGLMPLAEEAKEMGAPPHWMGYIATDDLDATVSKAQELGAKVFVPATDIPEVGRFAILQDPQGAAFATYESAESYEPRDRGIGDFTWAELATTDYQAAFEFYSNLFDWVAADDMDMGEGMMYRLYKVEGMDNHLGGIYDKNPEQQPGPPAWLYYVTVEDIDAACERVKTHGGQVVNGPMEVPGEEMIAQCVDPQGAFFALHMRGST